MHPVGHRLAIDRDDAALVTTWTCLRDLGITPSRIRSQLSAGRWQRAGLAIVMHNGPLTDDQRWSVGQVHGGPRALLTGFTAARAYGLTGWDRATVDLLVPGGTKPRAGCPVPVRLHRVKNFDSVHRHPHGRLHALADALVVAAATFATSRPACGILAAAVQQRLVRPAAPRDTLHRTPSVRHRRLMLAAVADIAQGSDALSEIDFVRRCRRYRLPAPVQQQIRVDSRGCRRYLDAVWRRADGRTLVVEVDGALHLAAARWFADQLRQNEIALSGALVLRFPSVVVRAEPEVVAVQLRLALLLTQ